MLYGPSDGSLGEETDDSPLLRYNIAAIHKGLYGRKVRVRLPSRPVVSLIIDTASTGNDQGIHEDRR